jgi:hypothetical protein
VPSSANVSDRLTSDIYPADLGWTVNWDKPEERQEWYHNMSSVMQMAGVSSGQSEPNHTDIAETAESQYIFRLDKQFCNSKNPK